MRVARTVLAAALAAAGLIHPASAGPTSSWTGTRSWCRRSPGQNALNEARIAAITQLAVFEAVNAITNKYDPYLGTITAPAGASTEAAAIVAAHDVLVHYLPSAAVNLAAARAASLSAIPDGQSKEDGMAVGAESAAAMIAERVGDGSSPLQFYLPGPPASRRLAGHAELQPGGRRVLQPAHHAAVRARERRPVPRGPAAGVPELEVHARLHRGQEARAHRQPVPPAGPRRRGALLRCGAGRADLEPGHAPGRGRRSTSR